MAKNYAAFVAPFDDRVREFLAKHRIFLAWPRKIDGVYEPGEALAIDRGVVVEPYATMPHRRFRSMGGHSVCLSDLNITTRIGRHSLVGEGVEIMGVNHPTNWVTTHPFPYRPYAAGFARRAFGREVDVIAFPDLSQPVTIGHGVTIGEGALLKQGVTIGSGAVVRPGAVVTRDVEPYHVVSGAPARSLGPRFDPNIVARLMRLEWWNVDLVDLVGLPIDDGPAFSQALRARIKSGQAQRNPPKPIPLAKALRAHLNASLETS